VIAIFVIVQMKLALHVAFLDLICSVFFDLISEIIFCSKIERHAFYLQLNKFLTLGEQYDESI
jgi:hypothetical protein